MFNLDERLKGLPAVKEQVVSLYQSLNQPHLAIPGKKAGPATAFVLGLRGPQGFAAFVYLYLHESAECAVYVPSNGTVAAERYEGEEAEALGFVESMGFIVDNLNFRGRPPDEQDAFIKTLPVFQREPPRAMAGAAPAAAKPGTGPRPSASALGKLFAAFCLSAGLVGCAHLVTEKDHEQANIHYELAVQNIVASPQVAFKEVEDALKLDPTMAEAWHVKGILLHLSFGRVDEAQQAYLKALELKDPFSEARTNLGNVYMDLKRYDEAIAQYELALNDMLCKDCFIAHGNMGWAYYRKGDVKSAVDHLKASVTLNPKYCRGYQQLGSLLEEQADLDSSCKYYGRYRDHCPEVADAWQHDGQCQLRSGNKELALKAFTSCVEKSKSDEVKEACLKLKGQVEP